MKIIYKETDKEVEGLSLANGKIIVKLASGLRDVIIKFLYGKIKGGITVLFLDEEGNEIAERIEMKDLDLGEYTVQAKEIEGYELIEGNLEE